MFPESEMVDSENSRSQIVFRTDIFPKLSLGAPVIYVVPLLNGQPQTATCRFSEGGRLWQFQLAVISTFYRFVMGYNSALFWVLSVSCLCLAKSIFTQYDQLCRSMFYSQKARFSCSVCTLQPLTYLRSKYAIFLNLFFKQLSLSLSWPVSGRKLKGTGMVFQVAQKF